VPKFISANLLGRPHYTWILRLYLTKLPLVVGLLPLPQIHELFESYKKQVDWRIEQMEEHTRRRYEDITDIRESQMRQEISIRAIEKQLTRSNDS